MERSLGWPLHHNHWREMKRGPHRHVVCDPTTDECSEHIDQFNPMFADEFAQHVAKDFLVPLYNKQPDHVRRAAVGIGVSLGVLLLVKVFG